MGQMKLKQEIEKIEEISKIKLSFIKEVSEMFRRPETERALTINTWRLAKTVQEKAWGKP